MSSLMQPIRLLTEKGTEKASEYWLGISARERQLLSLAGCLLIVWSVYFGVIRQVQDGLTAAEQRLEISQKQYDQVVEKAKKIAELQAILPANATAAGNQSLDVLVNRTAGKTGITITGLNRQQDSLQVRMNPVSFDKLIQWTTLLEGQGVNVSSLQIARTDKPGIVDIQQLRVEKETL